MKNGQPQLATGRAFSRRYGDALGRVERTYGAANDLLERRQAVLQCRVTQAVIREQTREISLVAVERHVIQDHHVDEEIDIVSGRCCRALN